MGVDTTVFEHRLAVPPEPGLTPEDVVARAEAMIPALVERQAETEQRTFYGQDVHEEFSRAGFYRILVPRRFGGYEFGIDTFVRVAINLTRGCPSTGWMYCLGAAHALPAATLFGERAQEEIFASGEFVCPATVMPGGSAERTADGDWLINGTWGYCSGSPYATHFMGHALLESGEPMLFIAPRSEWTRLDDWGQALGLKGSGSHSIRMENGRVPDRYTIKHHMSQVDVTGGTPGRALHGPAYGGGQLSFMVLEDALLAVGMARGALDAYEDLMRTRTTPFPPIVTRSEDPDFQFRYGKAAGLIATAEAATLDAARQWREASAAGAAAVTHEHELGLAGICHEAVALCWRAVESYLFPTAGSSAVRSGERIERVWRDMSMFVTHAGVSTFLATIAKRDLAKARFGLE
ncbi:acyl-CoA dehydrogenase family protein [Planomonospora sp. ID67723]|uniref:acyl-CoA dehydrogenase family protein n=1 Tax=Planomonospora sp. ID67723 TaxID=2738134 RepID=UPI0018C415EB|nr:acyl-CoA dehydrogenase family protein [Planomonospora sp. ID67723]MBG0829091.1 acyl-CoA dehydrogenase family protein [Planomonospora sp. ID67723]